MFQLVKDFHEKFGLVYDGPPRELPPELARFRERFMDEELIEYVISGRLEDRLDALVDLTYVIFGTALLHGFNFEEAFRRVHEANMLKMRASSADDSKRNSAFDVVKPPGWTPPDLSDLCV